MVDNSCGYNGTTIGFPWMTRMRERIQRMITIPRKVAVSEIEFSSNLESGRHAAITLRCSTNDPLSSSTSFFLSSFFGITYRVIRYVRYSQDFYFTLFLVVRSVVSPSKRYIRKYSSWFSSSRKIKIDIPKDFQLRILIMSE